MKFKQLPFWIISCLFLFSFILVPIGEAQASTISVKLVNYLGNRGSLDFDTVGYYKLANNNTRYSGQDRFEVANNVASGGWSSANSVIVVNYLAFADALAAAPLAKKLDAPILLTKPDTLPDVTKSKIQSLHPANVFIIGGSGSVSTNVESQLRSIVQNVSRIGGNDRFEVSKNIAEKLGPTNTAIVTNGMVFSDALAIAPYAAQNQIPILLTNKVLLPDSTKAALQGKSSTLIIGGTGSVDYSIETQLPAPTRIGGADRYEVSANIIKQLNLNAQTVFLSNGLTFADALTGSVLAAKQGAPLLLTAPKEIPTVVLNTIKDKQTSIVNVLGGTASVSDQVVSSLPNEYVIAPNTKYTVAVENGRLGLYKGSQKIKDFGTDPFTLATNYSTSNLLNIYGSSKKTYLGNMKFVLDNGYVRPINESLPVEDYLKGVVPIEMSPQWNDEALKAQAVAARTFVKRYDGGMVDDTQNYQVYGGYYGGYTSYASKINNVVDGTKDMVLRSNGNLITAMFSSSNGGKILTNTNTFGTSRSAYPYFVTKDDPYDLRSASPHKEWSVTLYKQQIDLTGLDMNHPYLWWGTMSENAANSTIMQNLKKGLVTYGYIKSTDDIKIVGIPELSFTTSFTSDQRIDGHLKLQYMLRDSTNNTYITDANGAVKVNELSVDRRAYDIRSMLGSTIMKSPYIKSVQDNPDNWTFIGGGWGHGIGMSQFGANQMASESNNYIQILQFYYPGASIVNQ